MVGVDDLEAGQIYVVTKAYTGRFTRETTWYDCILRFTGRYKEYAMKRWNRIHIGKIPIMEDAAGYIHIPNEESVYHLFTLKDIKGKEIDINGLPHRFVDFYTHHDSETGKPKDFLYQLENVNTDEMVLLKPFEAVTHKFEELIKYVYFYEGHMMHRNME